MIHYTTLQQRLQITFMEIQNLSQTHFCATWQYAEDVSVISRLKSIQHKIEINLQSLDRCGRGVSFG